MFQKRSMQLAQVNSSWSWKCAWNWKCALLSATARSLLYLVATLRSGLRGSMAIVLVELAYVTFTSGIYAGLQQRALGLRPRALGNFVVALGVPALAQSFDWLVHRAAGPAVAPRATFAVCIFTFTSALFHLHVMRNGAFLTGGQGRSLIDDFRRMPRLVAGFIVLPVACISARMQQPSAAVESEAAL